MHPPNYTIGAATDLTGGSFWEEVLSPAMNSQNPWIGILLIFAVGAALGLGYNALQPRALPWIAQPKVVVTLDSLTQPGSDGPGKQTQAGEQVTEGTSPQVSIESAQPKPVAPAVSTTPSPSVPNSRGQLTGRPAPAETAPLQESKPGASTLGPGGSEASVTMTANAFSDIPESEYPIEIHLDKTKEFYDRGGLIILDARETEEFAEGHIRGALSAPGDAVGGDLEWLERMSKEPRPILIYCGGGDCELSINLGFELTRAGHHRVLVFKEGFPAWKDAGYPVLEGTAP